MQRVWMVVGAWVVTVPMLWAAEGRMEKEQTYTITSVMQILQPVNPADMTDDFQDCRVLEQDKDSCTVEVTYYPLHQQRVDANPNWRADDKDMTEYLKPTLTENWDAAMRKDLVSELQKAGIDPDRLTDKELVEQVARWTMNRARTTSGFFIWACTFQDGKPAIYPMLQDVVERNKPDPAWMAQQTFDTELLGKAMYYNRTHGSCTSTAIYMATILRALGIPTRMVFCVPPFDPNDESQARTFYDGTHHHMIREIVRGALDGMGGFDNHIFNEVYVGKRWVRLNYSRLGQPIVDRQYFGLLTHIYTCADMSQVPLAQTWGMRYFRYPADQQKLASVNPYRLVSVQDHFGTAARLDNPQVPPAEYRIVTIDAVLLPDSPLLPEYFGKAAAQGAFDLFLLYRERVDATHPMRGFSRRAGHEFLLRAPGCEPVKARWTGASVSASGVETCALQIAPDDKARIVPAVAYRIEPVNISQTYRWVTGQDVTVTFPKR